MIIFGLLLKLEISLESYNNILKDFFLGFFFREFYFEDYIFRTMVKYSEFQ
jgi:hypothetical protein